MSAATVRKTFNLPPELIERARRILGAKTETEAIVRSLREVAFLDEVGRVVKATAGEFPRYRPLR